MSTGSLMIIGGQWGDEGKGKVVDLLSAGFAAVVRYNGGNNAGHTVRFADRRFATGSSDSGGGNLDCQAARAARPVRLFGGVLARYVLGTWCRPYGDYRARRPVCRRSL